MRKSVEVVSTVWEYKREYICSGLYIGIQRNKRLQYEDCNRMEENRLKILSLFDRPYILLWNMF